jgi:hypothetical protein
MFDHTFGEHSSLAEAIAARFPVPSDDIADRLVNLLLPPQHPVAQPQRTHTSETAA